MAEQRPLVLIDGDIQQLPVGDTTAGATGGGGDSELEVPYNTQVDFVGDTHIYKGWANPGTATSDATWRIQKITFVGTEEDVVITWAEGNGNFDNIWDNRVSLAYS